MKLKKEKIKHIEIEKSPTKRNNWKELKLGQIVDPNDPWAFTGGPFGSNLKVSDYTPKGVRIIQLQNIGDGFFHNDYKIFTSNEKADQLKSCNIYPGEIIISKMGNPVARACIVPSINKKYLMCSDGVRLNIDKSKYDTYFIYYQINSFNFRTKAKSCSTGSTRKRVSLSELKSIKLNIPCLKEQKKIAAVLSQIQRNITVKDQLIKTTKELKKSVMKYLFTYGTKNEQTKQTEIGQIPKSWNILNLGKLFDLKQGQSLSSKKQTGKYLKYFLRTSNVLWSCLDLSKLDQMDILPKNREYLLLKKDDLLICEGGDIGRTAIWNDELKECYFQNHIHRLRVKASFQDDVFPLFYMYWMDVGIRIFKVYGTFGNRTTIPNLSGKHLLQFSVPLPSLEEQKKIAGILQKIDERIKNYEEQKASLQDLFKSMLHKLMTAQIRLHNIKNINTEIVGKVELQ